MGNLFYRKKKETLQDIPKSFWEITAKNIDGVEVNLSDYQSKKAILVVNVASACGLTNKQYKGMVSLHEQYADKGFEILAFPCNQFMGQEDKCDLDIKQFVTKKFGVKFPLFSKVEVNGTKCHPVFKYLRHNSALGKKLGVAQEIPWNFAKFLLNSEGKVVQLFAPDIRPEVMAKDIEALLAQ